MSIAIVALFVATQIHAQQHSTALTDVESTQIPPFQDLFPHASGYFPDPVRKSYLEPSHSHTICSAKSDTLSSFASVLGSAAKIMLAAAAITFLKVIGGKLLLLPFSILVMAKIAVKTFLLWPMLSKFTKYLRKKKKKVYKGRSIVDCSERFACVIRKTVNGAWSTNLGSAVAFSIIEDFDDSYGAVLFNILAGENVAKCMEITCSNGADISIR